MFTRTWSLIVKEFIQFGRDRLLALFVLTFPVLQLILLAQATGRGITHLRLAVIDLDRCQESRHLIAVLDNTQELDVRYRVEEIQAMRRLLDRGQADVAVVIPKGFCRDLVTPGTSLKIQVIADASNDVVASTAQSAAEGAIRDFVQEQAAAHGIVMAVPMDFRPAIRFNSTLDTRHFAIPAQLGFIVYQVTLAVASLGLARERELGTLEQLVVAPLRRFELATGKVVPAVAISTVEFVVMFWVTVHVFKVPMRGSFPLLLVLTVLFISAEVGWGLLLSTVARTQQQAILFVFILAMVDMTFSGYLAPVKNMPWLLQKIAALSMLQYYLVIMRGIMLKGATIRFLWQQAVALCLLGIGIAMIALQNLNKRLD